MKMMRIYFDVSDKNAQEFSFKGMEKIKRFKIPMRRFGIMDIVKTKKLSKVI